MKNLSRTLALMALLAMPPLAMAGQARVVKHTSPAVRPAPVVTQNHVRPTPTHRAPRVNTLVSAYPAR